LITGTAEDVQETERWARLGVRCGT